MIQQEFNFSFDMPGMTELEDSTKGFSGLATELSPQKEKWLSEKHRSLSDDQLLDRYRQFLKRNKNGYNLHRYAGYRHLRGEAYRRRLFDEIDAIDRESL